MKNTSQTRVTILGSGTCVPSLERSACAALITTAEATIVLDCGPGTMRRLTEAGIAVSDVSHILLSHFHPDHTGELASFIFANKYPLNRRRKKPLALVAGKGLSEFYRRLKTVYGHWIELPPEQFRLHEMAVDKSDGLSFADFTVTSAPVVHNPESLAFKITGPDGKTVVYSGDTDFSENLITLAQKADLLICEAAFPAEFKVPGHLTPPEAGTIATRAAGRALVLTHLYPECDQADMLAECRQTWSGPLELAADLMEIIP